MKLFSGIKNTYIGGSRIAHNGWFLGKKFYHPFKTSYFCTAFLKHQAFHHNEACLIRNRIKQHKKRMNDTNSGASVSSTGMPQESPEKKKKGLLVALCAVAVLLCVGLGCYFHFQSESDAEYLAYQVLENNDNPPD